MKIVNNSEITTVINQTQNLSVVSTTISISYEESLARVELVIRDNLDRIRRNIPEIAEGLFYKGVTAHSASSVDLLFMSNCREEDYLSVGRAMNRELKLLFDENGIEIPYNQIVEHQAKEQEAHDATYREAREAKRFVDEQAVLSKDLEEENS